VTLVDLRVLPEAEVVSDLENEELKVPSCSR